MKKIFTVLGIAAFSAMNAQIVINEVYGGGGSATSLIVNDYVELANIGTTTATVATPVLQYASATGQFNSYIELPSITLNPGQKYLIEMIASTPNTTGSALPTADFKASQNKSFANGNTYKGGFNMSASAGKVVLTNNATQVTSVAGSNVLDFVGYGGANLFEGSGATPTIDTNTSVSRNGADTNDNAKDFTKGAPSPTNMAGQTLSTFEVNGKKVNLLKNTFVDNTIVFGAKAEVKIYSVNGQLVKSASVNNGSTMDVSSLSKGVYIVTGEADGQKVSQKIIKK